MQEFEKCPFGILGLETAIGLTLEKLVHTGRIPIRRMIELYTTGPDRILRLGRGTLTPGRPADITIIDSKTEWTYDVNKSASRSRNSPFDGTRFRGGPVATVVNGAIVWRRDGD
jgi:dihydroorotase